MKKTVLLLSLLSCGLVSAHAKNPQGENTLLQNKIQQALQAVEQKAEQIGFEATMAQLTTQPELAPDTTVAQICTVDENGQKRCTECGKTPQEAAVSGHPHKPPYIFQEEQSTPRTSFIYHKDGRAYFRNNLTGKEYPLPVPPTISETASTTPQITPEQTKPAPTDTASSPIKRKHPVYW